ncbi:MAG: CDP-glycerol glycerophosphotransferase family protein [Clostridia bacterium]|nr:CDP-glycerol glycerophosphotransferase family protein [Clostridia bacterium]
MKILFYHIYALFFHLGRFLPHRENLVALVSPHNASLNDSLGEIKRALEEKGGYCFLTVSGADIRSQKSFSHLIRFFVINPVRLARAKYIFLNDNFMPMAYLHFRKGTVITQLWHGEGALKKMCLALNLPDDVVRLEKKVYRNYTYVIVSSEPIVPLWAQAFDKEEKDVLPLGSPRTDAFFRPFDYEKNRAEFDSLFPECKGKKLVLYAPTFRDSSEQDKSILEHFDTEKFNSRYADEYSLLIRLHPQVHSVNDISGAVNVTDYPDIIKLLHLTDVLITDYSSVFMDYVLLDKPCIFYPYDYEEYIKSRELFTDYFENVPGPVTGTFEGLLQALDSPQVDPDRYRVFKKYHLGSCDGSSAKRVIETVMK